LANPSGQSVVAVETPNSVFRFMAIFRDKLLLENLENFSADQSDIPIDKRIFFIADGSANYPASPKLGVVPWNH